MKIVSLLENVAYDSNVHVEHGLSLYIETKGKKILFDMGGSDLFAVNAQTLGVNLNKVDLAVISHGHGVTAEGLRRFLALTITRPFLFSLLLSTHITTPKASLSAWTNR